MSEDELASSKLRERDGGAQRREHRGVKGKKEHGTKG